jgi:hypothetical protein
MADPIRLSDVVAEISRLYSTVKQTLDRKSLKALGTGLIALRKTINDDMLKVLNIVDANGELSDQKLDQWQAQPPAWKLDVLKKLEQKVVLEDSVELSEFFANVSTAVIDAQKNLNIFSRAYVDELEKSNSRIPPTYFAIPSIKAEMKLGFSEMSSKGVNVILFKNEQQKKQYVESTVTFELVAAPPLPGRPPEPGPVESVPEEGLILESMLGPEETPFELEFPRLPLDEPKGEESEADLGESLRLARAALFAATDRLLEAKEEVTQDQQASSVKAAKKRAAPKKGRAAAKPATKKAAKKIVAGKSAKKGRK